MSTYDREIARKREAVEEAFEQVACARMKVLAVVAVMVVSDAEHNRESVKKA